MRTPSGYMVNTSVV